MNGEPNRFVGNFRIVSKSVHNFFQYSWQVFVHDNSFLSKKVWVVFIIYRAQVHVASCICVLIRPLDATVHCGHFFNVFAMECILDKTYHVHLYS